MKKIVFFVTCLALAISCSNVSDTDEKPQTPSINDPETMAYLHNAALSRIVSPQTKSGDTSINAIDGLIPYVCNIVLEEAASIGINETISDEELSYIENMSTDQIAHFSLTNEELAQYYIELFPFSDDIKDRLYELSMYDLEMGTTTYLDYMNSLNNTGTKSTSDDMNAIAQFCAIGNASNRFWLSHETKGLKDMSARDWLATGADIAGSFLAAGIIGVIISTVFSLNMGFADVMSLEDAMNTNCD